MSQEIDYKTEFEKLQAQIIDREFTQTFAQQGGKQGEGLPTAENPSPSMIAKTALGNRLTLVNGKVGVTTAGGELLPLDVAIAALKQSGYAQLFTDAQQPTPAQGNTFTAAEARAGKASIDKIATGKATVV